MNSRLFLLLISMCLVGSPLLAQKKKIAFELTPVGGYRQDNIKWTTSNGSFQQWKSIQFIDYGLETKLTYKDRYLVNLDLWFANVLSGTMNESGYLAAPGSGNPRNNSLNAKGFAFRPNIAFGFNTKPVKSLDLIPQIGYIYDKLKLSGKVSSGNPLNSLSNNIQWHGPYLGVDSKIKLSQRWSMQAAANINLAFYHTTGNWTFRNQTTSNTMSQGGTGYGLMGKIGAKYLIVKSVALGGEADIHWNHLKNGHDTRNFANGKSLRTKPLKVNWTSFAGRVTLTKTF